MSVVAALLLAAAAAVAPLPAAGQQEAGVIVEIRIRGNYSIPDETLIAAAGVAVGDRLEPGIMAAVEERLRATEGVGEAEVLLRYRSMSSTDEVVLLINVTERVAVTEKFMFLPIFRWTDEYGVTFGVGLATSDLLGFDERLSFPLTWGGQRRAATEATFEIDNAAVSRIEAGIEIRQDENPHYEVADRRFGGWIEATKRWTLFEVGGSVGLADVTFDRDRGGDQLEYGVHAAIDTRQDLLLPRNAFYIGGAWDHLTLFGDEEARNRYTADLRGYKSLIGRSIIAAQAYYRGVDGPLPDWERPFLGGARTVRGYDAGEFVGDNIALVAAELRVPITPPVPVGLVGLNFFFDTGTVYDYGTPLGKSRFVKGVGGGIYFFAAFVGLQVDVAYGIESEEVHVHFSSGFRF